MDGNPADIQAAFFFVEDNDGAGQDRMAFEVLQQLPTACPTSPSLRPPLIPTATSRFTTRTYFSADEKVVRTRPAKSHRAAWHPVRRA